MLPMPFVQGRPTMVRNAMLANVIRSQLRLQHEPPMPLVHARPTMVQIVVFGNALRSHLRLQ